MRWGYWTGALVLLAIAGHASAASLGVWTLPAGGRAMEAGVDSREGWTAVEPEAAPPSLGGGAALENPYLLVAVPAGANAISVFTQGTGKARGVRQDLVLLDAQGQAATGIGQIKLIEHSATQAVLGFAAGAVEARLKMNLAGPFLEIVPGKNAGALQVRGAARFSFLPDFFGNDVLFDPAECRAGTVFAPAENFLVNLLDGQAALTMLVWPKDGGEEALLLPEGEGQSRRFGATQVSFNGKSVFVAVLAREGIWCGKDLRAAAKDKTFAVPDWRPPFPAKWMTILAKRPTPGAASGLASETLEVRSLPPEGDDPYSDVYVHPRVPSWLTGSEWRLHLQTKLTHMMTRETVKVPEFLLAINYPRDRAKGTPLDAFTLVDVMRGTLGAGPCEYILDLEGLNKTRSTGAAGTGKPTAAATCSERGALVYYYLGERAEHPRRDDPLMATDQALESVEKIRDFLDAAYARIQEYLAWSNDLIKVAEEAKAKDPAAKDLADRVIAIAREMQQLWAKMAEHRKPCAFPAEWKLALDHCQELIRRGAPNLGVRVREFDPQMRGAGEEVDGGMQACRMFVKRIRQEAALAGSSDPRTLRLAAEIRRLCSAILRNKHYKEGDSIRLGALREAAR
jgi:hypothetical protein